jgi:putative transposase
MVPKGSRRVGGLSDMIISLYAGGMTIRDIQAHLERTLGTELSHETISNITDAVLEEVKAWQTRPLEPVYPILYLDALVVKVKESHQVRNKAAHIAVGVDCDGVKHVLGIWVQTTEGAKFWAGVLAELRNRGVADVLIASCDGLTGFPEAIEATWPQTVVQTCVVHLIRASMRFISYNDRKAVAAGAATHLHRPHRSGRGTGAGHLRRLRSGARSIRPRSGYGETPGRVAPAHCCAGAP